MPSCGRLLLWRGSRVAVALDELRDLFTGVPADDGSWDTVPSYSVKLAYEIAKRADCASEHQLRCLLFDSSDPDDIPGVALDVMRIAAEKWRADRARLRSGRGL
jgi:hypothetical protein